MAEAYEWLLHVRLGRDCAESTTEAYARSLGLFLDWCAVTGQACGCGAVRGTSLSEPERMVDAATDEESWRCCGPAATPGTGSS